MAPKKRKQGIGETFAESTRVAVETAVDMAKGANRDTWQQHRSRLKGKINLWEENVPPPSYPDVRLSIYVPLPTGAPPEISSEPVGNEPSPADAPPRTTPDADEPYETLLREIQRLHAENERLRAENTQGADNAENEVREWIEEEKRDRQQSSRWRTWLGKFKTLGRSE